MKHKAFLILLMFLSIQLIAQQNNTLKKIQTILNDSFDVDKDSSVKRMFADLPSDTIKRQVKSFQKNFKSEYLSDEDFNYTQGSGSYSYWQLFKKRIINFLKKLFGYAPDMPAPKFTEILIKSLVGIVILIVLFIAIRIFVRHKGRWFFEKNNKELSLDIYDTVNLIEKADFRQLIAENEKKGDTRSCIRLYFLWILKTLKDKNLIQWMPDKTNSEYKNEISDTVLKDEFSYLSYIYEYVWYGEFILETNDYLNAKLAFEKLLEKEIQNG